MKKLIILSSALCVLSSYSANAQISVTLGEPAYYAQPSYVVRPDYPSEHYNYRHRDHDYWARRQQEERQHHDNDNHGHR